MLGAGAREADVEFAGLPLRNDFDLGQRLRSCAASSARERPDVIHVHKGVAHALALAATYAAPVGAFVVNRGVSFPLDRLEPLQVPDAPRRPRRHGLRADQARDRRERQAAAGEGGGRLCRHGRHALRSGEVGPRAFRREKGIADDRFLVAQVGVRDWKGWKELIDAVVRRRAGASEHPPRADRLPQRARARPR